MHFLKCIMEMFSHLKKIIEIIIALFCALKFI